jgi:hypothetical protein
MGQTEETRVDDFTAAEQQDPEADEVGLEGLGLGEDEEEEEEDDDDDRD